MKHGITRHAVFSVSFSFFLLVNPLHAATETKHFSSAEQFRKSGNHTEAIKEYLKVIARNPHHFEALFFLANSYFRLNDFENAAHFYAKTTDVNPACHQAYFNGGLAYTATGKPKEAIQFFIRATDLQTDYQKAWHHLGELYYKQNEFNKALPCLQKAVALNNNDGTAHRNLGRVYCELNEFDMSAFHFKKAYELDSNNTGTLLDLANTLNMGGRVQEALETYYELLDRAPSNTSIRYNIAYTLKKLGKVQEAIPLYERIIQDDPNYAEAHFGLGLSYLILGNEKGWEEYEWRWNRSNYKPRNFSQPQWDGSDIAGKTILLHAEQGLGDTFQFIRYAKEIKLAGATVIVATQTPLVELLQLCPYIDTVVALHDKMPLFDCHAPLLSMPYLSKTTFKNTPNDIPYLYADEQLVEYWRNELQNDTNFKIGICWQGNPNYSTHFLRNAVAAKSFHVNTFAPISQIPGVSIYSLQRMSGEDQLSQLTTGFDLITFDESFDRDHGRFMDTAALITNLDLIISVDTSTGHLAAALGKPTWLLLPEPPDWRWMLKRTDTPWYPNMRLFRQQTMGDWNLVISNVCTELHAILSGNKTTDQVTVEVSIGELIDKITILQIKSERITNPEKLQNIHRELESLQQTKRQLVPQSEQLQRLTTNLKEVNEILWDIEDAIRDKERERAFDDEFIELARSIYYTNDKRCSIKREINNVLGSTFVEEKSYQAYA